MWQTVNRPYRQARRATASSRARMRAAVVHNAYGLSDYQSDCENTIRSYPASYVFAGSRFRWSGNASSSYSYLPGANFADRNTPIRQAVQARGYYDVVVNASKLTIGVTIDFSVPIDQSSRNDVQQNIEGAIQAAGYTPSGGDMKPIYTPKASDICKGVASAGGGKAPGYVLGGSAAAAPSGS